MKSLINSVIICLLLSQLIACKKEGATPPSSLPPTASSIAGNFTVGSFIGSEDKTSTFDGFTFTFKENGTITATKGNETFNGTWRFDDGNSTEIKIFFATAPLNELNKSWHIAELTADHFYLTDHGEYEDESDDDHSSDGNRLEFERD